MHCVSLLIRLHANEGISQTRASRNIHHYPDYRIAWPVQRYFPRSISWFNLTTQSEMVSTARAVESGIIASSGWVVANCWCRRGVDSVSTRRTYNLHRRATWARNPHRRVRGNYRLTLQIDGLHYFCFPHHAKLLTCVALFLMLNEVWAFCPRSWHRDSTSPTGARVQRCRTKTDGHKWWSLEAFLCSGQYGIPVAVVSRWWMAGNRLQDEAPWGSFKLCSCLNLPTKKVANSKGFRTVRLKLSNFIFVLG